MAEQPGYLYAFKYHDMSCEIDGERFVLAKFGKVAGWSNLMDRFNNHQTECTHTFENYPKIPKHSRSSTTGGAALYERSCRGRHVDGVYLSDEDSVRHTMKNESIASLYKREEDWEQRAVWPDLAYISAVPESHATFMEGVVPWSLVTYLDQSHLKEQLDRTHRLHYHTADSNVSHEESFLLSERCFETLRELFVANGLDMHNLCQLTFGVRECPSEETVEVELEWTTIEGNRRTMPVRYFTPLYAPERAAVHQGLGLVSSHRV